MIEIGINSQILKQILDGKKTVEGRLAKDKFLAIRPGDVVSIREDIYDDGVIVESRVSATKLLVTKIATYNSFSDMLGGVGFKSAIPSAASLEDACLEYARYYSAEDEKNYGVLAIYFKLLSS